jgi:hypothetical protein
MRLIERFESLYTPEPNTGCWLWMEEIRQEGYGVFKIGTRPYDAHRLSYFIHSGSIPFGLLVCHTCDTRACINPNHLFLGTYLSNARDASIKGRLAVGENRYGAKLTEQNVRDMLSLLDTDSYSQKQVGTMFGISQQVVSDIVNGYKWSHITGRAATTKEVEKILPHPGTTLMETFHASYERDSSGCWIWNQETSRGYGILRMNRTTISAHRVSYELFVDQIPPDMDVCHACDVTACVNPQHLWVGTHQENMQDAAQKGRIAHGSRSGASKLTESSVIEMIGLYNTGKYSTYKLGELYSMDSSTIYDIVSGNTWKHVAIERLQPKKKKSKKS